VTELSQDEFNLWLRSSYSGAFYVAGHKFEKSNAAEIRIDNGLFTRDEAAQIYSMMSSKNPVSQINALFAVLERNGTLLWILLAVAFLFLALVIIRVRR
jgi:hypothetical protein